MESQQWEPCRHCGARWEPVTKVCTIGPHYAERRCARCGRHLGWVPKPDRLKPKREAAHTDLVQKYGNGYCQLCLIKQEAIPLGEAMEAHHVLEYTKHDGGVERHNVWILCTACHRLVHWRRTYLNHLLPEGTLNAGTGGIETAEAVGPVEDSGQRRQADEGAVPD